jgi:hypothetical protein
MPNHVQTNLTITGSKEDLDKFEATHIVEKEEENYNGEKTGNKFTAFDFDTIIPMPSSLNVTSGSHTDMAVACIKAEAGDTSVLQQYKSYTWLKEKLPENPTDADIIKALKENLDDKAMEEGRMSIENKEKYGHENWYDWKCARWGTKWGAYNAQVERETDDLLRIDYETAWSPATPIFDELTKMYPNLVFEQHVLDEGMGFGGTQHWSDGQYLENFEGCIEEFANEHFGAEYVKCEECGEYHDASWVEDGHDSKYCYNCNEERTAEEADLS